VKDEDKIEQLRSTIPEWIKKLQRMLDNLSQATGRSPIAPMGQWTDRTGLTEDPIQGASSVSNVADWHETDMLTLFRNVRT
jgi:hypothetical protein